jgi:hypothetical protein
MRRWLPFLAPLLAVGCAHIPPPPARVLNHRVDLWTPKTAAWAYDNCQLMGVANNISGGHLVSTMVEGNYTLLAEKSFYFACPELPPWPRHDDKIVREGMAVTPRDMTCVRSMQDAPTVNVTVPGSGKQVSANSIVRARVTRTEFATPAPFVVFHGRGAANKNEEAAGATLQPGARLPVTPAPFVTTSHVSCFGCMSKAVAQLREGDTATITCATEGTWEIQVLAVGGEKLFEDDLRLPPADD